MTTRRTLLHAATALVALTLAMPAAARASRWKRAKVTPSSARCGWRIFTATVRPMVVFSAL